MIMLECGCEVSDVYRRMLHPCATHRQMPLRDYFAGKALPQAIQHERDLRSGTIAPGDFRYESIAHAAYVMADAMIAEREK